MKNRKTTVFATVLTLAIIALLIISSLTSCSQAEVMATPKGVGFVRFSDANTFASSKSVELMAYIDYPDEYSLTWTVTASKTDTNGKQGEGVYEDVLLTDTLGPFSVGSWHFTLEGRGEKNRVIYTGETDKTIGEGNNTVHVDIAPPQEGNGTLRIQGSNFDSSIGDCFRIVSGDNNALMNMPLSLCELREDGLYNIPDTNIQVPCGVHTIRLYIGTTLVRTLKLRVFANHMTVLTYGTFEGTASLEVHLERYDAIVPEE